MKVAFYTLGCKVNQYETNVMIEQFLKEGHELVPFNKEADVYVINTCTVTNMSDRKSRQMISKAKKKNEYSVIVVVGCLAQVAKNELLKIPQIDLILGNEEKKNITYYVKEYIDKKRKNVFVSDISQCREYILEEANTFYDKTRAIIKIQDGCNNFCTYCIIPYARGRVRSKPFDSIINEANNIVKNGYKEIVLTGIHVCAYGQDLDNVSLIDLLERLNMIEGLERIRLSSLEPNIMTEEFLSKLSELDKVCPHFHLSIQSGCDNVLKKMNRKYTSEDLISIIKRIRSFYNNANITADVIVGFPSESKKDFIDTYELLQDISLNKIHVFPYSKREGTVAAKIQEQVESTEKHRRGNVLINMSNEKEIQIVKTYKGKEVEVLTEENDGEYTKGFTKNYIHAKIKGMFTPNTLIKCRVIETSGNILICEELV